MPHDSIWTFFIDNLISKEINNKNVLEIGSFHKYGGIRKLIETFFKPTSYTGVDIRPGSGVDMVSSFEHLVDIYSEGAFDVIICVEVIEHILDYKLLINTIKYLLGKSGVIFLTTRSVNFGYHLAPLDFWRFSIDHLKSLFLDMQIVRIISDEQYPGVFIKTAKPENFQSLDLVNAKAYSIILSKEINYVPPIEKSRFVCRLSQALSGTEIPLFSDIAAVINRYIK